MITHQESSEDELPAYVAPALRLFEVRFTDGERENISAHYVEPINDHLVFIDEELRGDVRVLYYRRTIAKGQWREVLQIDIPAGSSNVN